MPKSQYVDPVFLRKSGEITYKPTPVCAYDKTVADEKKNFKKELKKLQKKLTKIIRIQKKLLLFLY